MHIESKEIVIEFRLPLPYNVDNRLKEDTMYKTLNFALICFILMLAAGCSNQELTIEDYTHVTVSFEAGSVSSNLTFDKTSQFNDFDAFITVLEALNSSIPDTDDELQK